MRQTLLFSGGTPESKMESSEMSNIREGADSGDNNSGPGAVGSPPPQQACNYTNRYTLQGHKDSVSSVKFSPDGNWLATACIISGSRFSILILWLILANDKTIKIWQARTGQYEFTLEGHGAGISDVAWSPDSNMLVSASDDCNLILWNIANVHIK